MPSFRGLWIGMSVFFGCLLLALIGEVYYVLWWKKKNANRSTQENNSSVFASKKIHFFCWKTPSPIHHNGTRGQGPRDPIENCQEPDIELGPARDLLLKSLGEEGVDSELMRLHNLSGPPRFLFTIKEESKEDLESDDGKLRDDRSRKGSRNKSLSDLMLTLDTPFLTPLASPRLKSPNHPFSCYTGFNPLFESSAEAELNRLISSPPPKFKFLRDAEEKFSRRLKEEAEKVARKNGSFVQDCSVRVKEEKDRPFIALIGENNKEREEHHHQSQYHSGSSQVLPLASSPTTLRFQTT